MPWDYPAHKARLASDPEYKKKYYAQCRAWLRRRLALDPDYALFHRIRKRMQTRRQRKRKRAEAKLKEEAIMRSLGEAQPIQPPQEQEAAGLHERRPEA